MSDNHYNLATECSNSNHSPLSPAEDLLSCQLGRFGTILADPPWQFTNRTGKMAPEHKRLLRYPTMTLDDIMSLPVSELSLPQSHLYLWVPNALILEGLEVMKRWGFTYKTNLVWYKIRKDGGPDGRGVGFYFRNVTELILFGVRGSLRTKAPGRRQVNIVSSRKREHSRKPDELYDIIEKCSPGPYLELFARRSRRGWKQWGNEVLTDVPDLWNNEETKKRGPGNKPDLKDLVEYQEHIQQMIMNMTENRELMDIPDLKVIAEFFESREDMIQAYPHVRESLQQLIRDRSDGLLEQEERS